MRFCISSWPGGIALGAASLFALAACGQQGEGAATAGGSQHGASSSGSGTGAGGGGGTPRPLLVFDWNMHNFYNDKNDSDTPVPTDETILTTAQYLQKRQAIAAVIKPLDPDIIVVAEVEHQSILDDLNTDLGNAYTERVLIEGNDPRGLDVGAMSKLPFDSTKSHKDDKFQRLDVVGGPTYEYARDCLEVHLTYNGRKLALLGVHYRSKSSPDDPDKRAAEAQHTRVIADGITKADASIGVIILGDFNDVPGSLPVNWSLDGGGAGAPVYHDAPDGVSDSDRWSFDFSGSHELIDHQMSNPLLAPMLDTSSVTIPHGNQVQAASDHSPIMATYNIE